MYQTYWRQIRAEAEKKSEVLVAYSSRHCLASAAARIDLDALEIYQFLAHKRMTDLQHYGTMPW